MKATELKQGMKVITERSYTDSEGKLQTVRYENIITSVTEKRVNMTSALGTSTTSTGRKMSTCFVGIKSLLADLNTGRSKVE